MRFGFTVRLMSHDPICLDVSSSDVAHGWHPTSEDLDVLIHAKFPMFITGIIVAWDMMTVIFLCLIAGKVAYTYLQRHQRYDGLAYILVRDSIVYSIAIIVVTFVNAILILSAPYALYTVGCGFTASVPNVLANRIWINLREWEKFRKDRMEVDGITDFDKWETLFRITV
ncbi:hypothetical protein BC629DRAFT_1483351 [Irpex lacteus]|nr:hypothetical protein BC629DRAFT_1483351 [Irpex lacteus]